jgi:iron(III) transport system substrate-binding protein
MKRGRLEMLLLGLMLMVFPREARPQQWEKVLEAARAEGKVTVIGPVGADRRDVLVQPFQQKYGIAVEYFPDRGSGIGPRVSAERRAGLYAWDIVITGTTTGLNALVPQGMLDPMEPAFILPEVKDPKQWRGGEHEFVDSGRRFFVMTPSQVASLFVNPNTVKPEEIKSHKDLLAPRWKGKIVMDDPTRAGPGLGNFTFFYMHPDLGADYVRALAKQEPVILRDYAQELDGIVKEKFLILIAVSDVIAEEWMRKGLPVAVINPRQLKEGTGISPGSGGLGLFARAPHPNAAKIYINWLLSKEGQTAFAVVNGYVSARLDVPTDHAPWKVPIPGAIKTYTYEATTTIKDQFLTVFKEAFR